MLKIKVNSTWQGKVALRDKYIRRAEAEREDFLIECGGEKMFIPNKEIKKSIAGISNREFVDKFGGDPHRLYYFKWKPMTAQSQMF